MPPWGLGGWLGSFEGFEHCLGGSLGVMDDLSVIVSAIEELASSIDLDLSS